MGEAQGAQEGTGMHCGQTGGHNLCVCVCAESIQYTALQSQLQQQRWGRVWGGGQKVPNVGGQRFSFNCAIAACFTSTAAHCAHCACPQNDTSHNFSILFCASCDPREPPRACLHVFPSYTSQAPSPSIPSTHSVMQNVAYQLTLAKQDGGRGREREGECLQNFRVLYVICDFSS